METYQTLSEKKKIIRTKARLEFTCIVIKYCLDNNITIDYDVDASAIESIDEFLSLSAYDRNPHDRHSKLLVYFGNSGSKGMFTLPNEYITDRLKQYLNDFTNCVYAIRALPHNKKIIDNILIKDKKPYKYVITPEN